jgi:hypothetical protein
MNGWKNYETWNVAFWLRNNEGFYAIARACRQFPTPYRRFVERLAADGVTATPSGVSFTSSKLAIRELNACIRAC